MNKQKSNQMASLRKKLLAAIAMLLVACIMTVSSTYAWFTLSTAPEVKGISTTVGANGNLEMALGYATYGENSKNTFTGSDDPSSAVGSAMDVAGIPDANITWGNLVDLSDASYGLNSIELYPTRLNVTATLAGENNYNFTLPRSNPLKFPVYGADGRISELSSSTSLGQFNSTTSGFETLAGGNMPYGVSAIGTASSMTERQYAIRNYKAAVVSSHSAAKAAAQGAIREHAGVLAALAIAQKDVTDTITDAEVAALNGLIARLKVSATNINDALVAAVNVVWTNKASDDKTWENMLTNAPAEQKADIRKYIEYMSLGTENVPTAINAYVNEYEAIVAALTTAETNMTTAKDNNYQWQYVTPVVSALLNSTGIKIGGYTVEEIQQDKAGTPLVGKENAIEDLTNNFAEVAFEFSAGSGIFANIADFTGDYSANITFPSGASIEGIPLTAMNGRPVNVKASASPAYLVVLNTAVKDITAPGNTEGAAQVLTDTYGYVVDLLFRTNASDSYLQLQPTATNRVYEDQKDANLATMGGGANMTFTMDTAQKADVDALAAGIRVVFFDTTGNILGVATLNTTNGVETATGYKVPLQLVEYGFTPVVKNGEIQGATLDVIRAKEDVTTTDHDESLALCALAANTKTAISALVYLDGDKIDNADAVMADLKATLNLQFSSSVDLTPMDNEALKNQVATSASATTTTTTTTTTATN